MRALLVLLLPLLALLVACEGDSPSNTSSTPTNCAFAAGAPEYHVAFPQSDNGSAETPKLQVGLAANASERASGLSNLDCLAPDSGMVFVWPSDTTAGFWMQDTHIPLSIAFVRADSTSNCLEGYVCGVIVSIQDMEPETTDSHNSPEPFRYAIEANQGWFAEHEVSAGDRVAIVDLLTRDATN